MPGGGNLGKSEALGGNLGKSEALVREFREVGCLGAGIKGSRRPWAGILASEIAFQRSWL